MPESGHPDYSYPGIELFDQNFKVDAEKETPRNLLIQMGPKINIERFIHSGQGEALIKSYRLQFEYADGMDKGVVDYWDKRGIVKEEHSEVYRTRWYSYVPKAALSKNSGKKYPLIINLPHDPFMTEARGYVELAAEKGLIVIIPAATDIEDIYTSCRKAMKMYPVDESRIYMAGFSFTGFRTAAIAMRHPEFLAGIAINSHFWPYIWQPPEKWIVDHLAGLRMPIINYVGNVDFGNPVPVYNDFTDPDTPNGSEHLRSVLDNLNAANIWMKVNGCKIISLSEVYATKSSENIVEREIGLPVSQSRVEIIDDTAYYFGDFLSEDGVIRTRLIVMDNVPHFPFGSMANVSWDFLKHFSRDPETGESFYTNSL